VCARSERATTQALEAVDLAQVVGEAVGEVVEVGEIDVG
jgi:hypothetical protein